MINIIINGALGRMGKRVAEACEKNSEVKVVCGVDIRQDDNFAFPIYDSFDKIKENADVIIDFSSPVTLDSLLDYAKKNSIGAVLCTTGYTEDDLNKINEASKTIPLFRSANMSLGVNVLISLIKKATENLQGFDIEIIEKHHNQKVDSPSGTALMLADAVKDVCPDKFYVYGREGKVGKRNPNEIGIHAIRGGSIVGEHDVLFAGIDETITISHQATDRGVFAEGAVKAAIYLSTKKKGIYNMQDVVEGK